MLIVDHPVSKPAPGGDCYGGELRLASDVPAGVAAISAGVLLAIHDDVTTRVGLNPSQRQF